MNLNRRKFLKFALTATGVLAIGKVFGFNWASQVKASPGWIEPGVTPPGDNVPAPINVGPVAQTKTGSLTIGPGTLRATHRLRIPVGTNMFS